MTEVNIIKDATKELFLGATPIGAGVLLFSESDLLGFILIAFGCGITMLLVNNYLEREKVLRSTYGYGYLK